MNLRRKKKSSKSNLIKRAGPTAIQKTTAPASSPGSAMAKLANITASAKVKMSDEELKANGGFYAAKLALVKMAKESKKNPKKVVPPTE